MGVFERLHSAGNTIVLVTHEADIAAYAHRTIAIRDGLVDNDTRSGEVVPRRTDVNSQLPTSNSQGERLEQRGQGRETSWFDFISTPSSNGSRWELGWELEVGI